MQTFYFIFFLLATLCFGAAAIGLWPKFNFMAAGLFFIGLVLVVQAGMRM